MVIHAFLNPNYFFIANSSVGPIETVLENINENKRCPQEILKLKQCSCFTTETVREKLLARILRYNLSKDIWRFIGKTKYFFIGNPSEGLVKTVLKIKCK